MWVLTKDNMPQVSEATGYTIEELENIFNAYNRNNRFKNMTIRIPKKLLPTKPQIFVWPKEGE